MKSIQWNIATVLYYVFSMASILWTHYQIKSVFVKHLTYIANFLKQLNCILHPHGIFNHYYVANKVVEWWVKAGFNLFKPPYFRTSLSIRALSEMKQNVYSDINFLRQLLLTGNEKSASNFVQKFFKKPIYGCQCPLKVTKFYCSEVWVI